MRPEPVYEFHLSRAARERCRFDGLLFAQSGRIVLGSPAAARALAAALTRARGEAALAGSPGPASAADLYAIGLLDEAMHLAIRHFRESCDPRTWLDALAWFGARLGPEGLERTLLAFCEDFPPLVVHRGEATAAAWLAGETGGVPHRAVALEELLLLWLTNSNPACGRYRELFDDRPLASRSAYARLTAGFREYFETRPRFGPESSNLVDFLRAPMRASPDSLFSQLDWLRERWAWLLGDLLARLLVGLDVLREEARWFDAREHARRLAERGHFGGDSGPGAIPRYGASDVEYERFSPDADWMPSCVLIAKSTHVWLDQLSGQYGRAVARLDDVPDSELDRLAAFGITGLWLIGLWERSRASRRIKQLCGNPDAAASAYSLDDYAIAADLGGEEAWANLRDRAAARGIRLASDMVPNHMGIDSRWVIEHPEWFLSLPESPYPSYTFGGEDLSRDPRVEIRIEDHYYDRSDAAVVFRRVDRGSGETRFVYHGNDGTSFPWNDTAQLDYLNPVAREQVIRTILAVARRFPIIRFDAAMTLARRHVQRLWFPEPGAGGAIPSRAERGMPAEQFLRAMPHEFWREVVDRVATEAPGTLLLAEAFWLMEGYFVRTLGMHRVYNSAFMNMLRDEQNANYRSVIKNTLEFDPEILQRYVNFMNNPDERTAVDQFGRGEKYFGVCTLLVTLPGLPMLGHGQIEGLEEKYGMEFRRAQRDEAPDEGLVGEHWRRIVPLLHRRGLFSGARDFRLYDCWADGGGVNEDVFAYSNRRGDERALVVFHNRWAGAHGWLSSSAAFAEKRPDGSRPLRQSTLGEALGADPSRAPWLRCRDVVSGLELLFDARALAERGLRVDLEGYGSRVLVDWRDVGQDGRPWGELCDALQGGGVANLDERMLEHELAPVQHAFVALADALPTPGPVRLGAGERLAAAARARFESQVRELIVRAEAFTARRSAAPSGLPGDADAAVHEAGEAFAALERAPALVAPRAWRGHLDAEAALPLAPLERDEDRAHHGTPWLLALLWIAARALGAARPAPDAEGAALVAFDTLRLRHAAHDALVHAELGWSDEDRWRGAALVRAALAHRAWGPDARADAPPPWRDDHDVRWLIGAHESRGVHWFGREQHAQFTWWMALPALLEAVRAPEPARARALEDIESWTAAELRRAEASAWRFDALLGDGRAGPRKSPSQANPAGTA
ncbi:MAG TPA: alpha-amylase family glycosyl hydrolase [Candidatus Acidoferrales bacterium]|nr:alpha-amylase family glycosyl hydrolase [Candidatus Acidoferrales bacterium]